MSLSQIGIIGLLMNTLNGPYKTLQQDHMIFGYKYFRPLDKREYLVIIRDNFYLFCIKTYVVTPHLNCLNETVQMKGHNIWFR